VTRLAHLDPVGGASGDMLLAAFLDAGAPLEVLERTVAALELTGARVEVQRVTRQGLAATQVKVVVSTRAHARPAPEMRAVIAGAALSPSVRARSMDAFDRLVDAEASVHGTRPADVVLHELGGDDTLVDICGLMALVDAMGIDRMSTGPLPLGTGHVDGAHGRLAGPAPATIALLRGVPVVGAPFDAELVTPTGAAIVATLADAYGPLPPMTIDAVGVGAGSRELPGLPNVVRVLVGEDAPATTRAAREVVVLEANVDDLVPELVPDVIDACLAAGALDAWSSPILMKKGRPGLLLSVLARPADEAVLAQTLLEHSSSLGVRVRRHARYELDRVIREVRAQGQSVRVKMGVRDGRVVNVAPEHDDCARVAASTGRPVKQIWAEALAAAVATNVGPDEVEHHGLAR
jgi:pyridinium-3,5-bisthiocarboxylic acid mononucleotide nickel chelatase